MQHGPCPMPPRPAWPKRSAASGRRASKARCTDWFRRCVALDNLIMLAYRDAGAAAGPVSAGRRSRRSLRQLDTTYLDGAYLLDPYHDLHLSRVPAGLYRLRDVAPDAFHRSRYFQEYYQQTTLVDELTFVAYPVAGRVAEHLPGPRRLVGHGLRPARGRNLPAASRRW